MSRPKRTDERTSTCIRMPKDLHDQLKEAAEERDVSMNWLINKALRAYMADLIPANELRLTRGRD